MPREHATTVFDAKILEQRFSRSEWSMLEEIFLSKKNRERRKKRNREYFIYFSLEFLNELNWIPRINGEEKSGKVDASTRRWRKFRFGQLRFKPGKYHFV